MRKPFHPIASIRWSSVRAPLRVPWYGVRRRYVFSAPGGKTRVRTLPIHVATAQVQKIDRKQVGRMMDGLRVCLNRLRSGSGHLEDVLEFGYATASATFIERQGVVRGLSQQIANADTAITAMRLRTSQSTAIVGPLFGNEIASLDELIRVHQYQLEQISQGEYEKILRSMAGKLGGKMQNCIHEVKRQRA